MYARSLATLPPGRTQRDIREKMKVVTSFRNSRTVQPMYVLIFHAYLQPPYQLLFSVPLLVHFVKCVKSNQAPRNNASCTNKSCPTFEPYSIGAKNLDASMICASLFAKSQPTIVLV